MINATTAEVLSIYPWLYFQVHNEYLMEKGIVTHSSFLVWEIPWIENPGGLQFMAVARVGPARGPRFSEQGTESPAENTNPVPGETTFSSTELVLGEDREGTTTGDGTREKGTERALRFCSSARPGTDRGHWAPKGQTLTTTWRRTPGGAETRALVLHSHLPGTSDQSPPGRTCQEQVPTAENLPRVVPLASPPWKARQGCAYIPALWTGASIQAEGTWHHTSDFMLRWVGGWISYKKISIVLNKNISA